MTIKTKRPPRSPAAVGADERPSAAKAGKSPAKAPVSRGRRGRPTLAQAEEKGSTIVAAACAMFLEEGYAVTTMEAVAARAGVSKGTLYSRYSTKADLFAAVVEDRVRDWSVRAARNHQRVPSRLKALLEHHVLIALESVADPEIAAFAELLFTERRRFPELARIYFDRAVLFNIDLMVKDIADAAAREKIAVKDPKNVAFMLMEAVAGWTNIRALGNLSLSPQEQSRAAKRIVSFMMGGAKAW